MIVNLWMSWMSILAKNENIPKTQKNNLKNFKYQNFNYRGPVSTFSLPGGRLVPMSVAPLRGKSC